MTTTAEKRKGATLPVFHPSLDGLLRESIKRGWICYEELNAALPDEFLSPEKIDELLLLISSLDIDLIGEDFRMRRG